MKLKSDPLTTKQYEVVYLHVVECLPAKNIADKLRKSKHTVNGILRHIYRSFNLQSNMQLANWFYDTYYYLIPKERKEAKVITLPFVNECKDSKVVCMSFETRKLKTA